MLAPSWLLDSCQRKEATRDQVGVYLISSIAVRVSTPVVHVLQLSLSLTGCYLQ
jgi:hypothetical protein